MNLCDPATDMRAFAVNKCNELLTVMVGALNAAAADPHADAVHDMRVSIRRLQQSLRVFRQYLPARAVKRLRKQLKQIMEHAGELRNCDIAIELTGDSEALRREFERRRAEEQQALTNVLTRIASPGLLDHYRSQLRLDTHEEAVEETPQPA